jgi:bacterioferritin-associated ferredoxin
MEPYDNFHWAFMSIACVRIYHYVVLQPISLLTKVNLNAMICPAVSDPFNGPYYRIAANLHLPLFMILFGKTYCFIGRTFFNPKSNNLNKEQIDEINKSKDEILQSIEDYKPLESSWQAPGKCANCSTCVKEVVVEEAIKKDS